MIRVLLVEDNEGDQKLLLEAFKDFDSLELTTVDTVDHASAILKNKKTNLPNFILLDLNLPGRNGKELLKELKADQRLRYIPVLVLTSSHADKDVADCYELGASCYLKKPMKFSELQSLAKAINDFWFNQVTFFSKN